MSRAQKDQQKAEAKVLAEDAIKAAVADIKAKQAAKESA